MTKFPHDGIVFLFRAREVVQNNSFIAATRPLLLFYLPVSLFVEKLSMKAAGTWIFPLPPPPLLETSLPFAHTSQRP